MSEEKLSSERVPPKFAEWLLSMGCPPEDVPPLDKISEMCRGQYYMVWRSLMEHVAPKDTILAKRLQVFNDYFARRKKNDELAVNLPQELQLWRELTEAKARVSDAEATISEEQGRLNKLIDKVSSKLAQRNLSKKRLQDAQRRSWLLQQVLAELREREANFQETRSIAESLCCLDDTQDVESQVDKCLSLLSRSAATCRAASLSIANPVASSSIASTIADNDTEEQVSSLAKCRGDVVFKQLFERRAGLCAMAATRDNSTDKDIQSPQWVLTHTAALHCSLTLGAVRSRAHIKQINKRLAAALIERNKCLSGEACELLVVRCERAHSAARAESLRALCDAVRAREGAFAVPETSVSGAMGAVHTVDKSIIAKRDELKRLIVSATAVEQKIQNVKEHLSAMFNSFHAGERVLGASQSIANTPQESISSIRQFYEERREKRNKKLELSMDLDVSESCSYESADNGGPKFADELKMYLKNFRLEMNRKFVLESGEKIWIFETVQSCLNRLYAKCQEDDVATSMLCPSVSVAHNLARLAQEVTTKTELEGMVRYLADSGKKYELSLDIAPITQEEEKTKHKIKKRLNENIINLQKSNKNLHTVFENLNIWSENNLKQYIADGRTVEGLCYKDYERMYFDCMRM